MTRLAIALAVLLATAAVAEERPIELKKAPGQELVQNNCASCHSLDYIQINAPFLNAAGWEAEVNKMAKVFGAPVEPADAKAMIEYLTAHYGK